jgi:rSAM/selenodomain-associated transferase 2
MIAVVVPVLDDFDALRALLADIPDDGSVELIVADGAADRRLSGLLAGRDHARLIASPRGRGTQMNAGAACATAPLLLFLHADSRLPPGWVASLRQLPEEIDGGWFRFRLDDSAWQARVIERLVDWRVRRFHLPYGDQGIFVRKAMFDRLGGFPPWPLMEDVDFVRRLVALGRIVELPLAVTTSARRWRRDGWFRRSARNLALISLFFAGVGPVRLSRWYGGP